MFDLGGGTFDVSILELVGDVFRVRATGGDSSLGGDDFDRLIARQMIKEAGVSVSIEDNQRFIQRVLHSSRLVKEKLSQQESAQFKLIMLDGSLFQYEITRDQFREWVAPILTVTGKVCANVVKDADLEKSALNGVILVGGSTRSVVVRESVSSQFAGVPILSDIDPDKVVALGAAIQADALVGGTASVLLLDVLPLSLGIEMMGGVIEVLIPRNSTIPMGAKQVFTTYADNQTGLDLHVLQGERETVEGNRSLARLVLKVSLQCLLELRG